MIGSELRSPDGKCLLEELLGLVVAMLILKKARQCRAHELHVVVLWPESLDPNGKGLPQEWLRLCWFFLVREPLAESLICVRGVHRIVTVHSPGEVEHPPRDHLGLAVPMHPVERVSLVAERPNRVWMIPALGAADDIGSLPRQ